MITDLKQSLERVPLFWRLQIIGWSAYFVYGCIIRTSHYQDVPMGVGMSLLLETTEFALSSVLRLIYRRLNFHTGLSARTLAYIALFSAAATACQLIITQFAAPYVADLADYQGRPSSLLTRIAFFGIIYVSWSAAYVWLKSEFAAREARSAAQRSELQMLRLQLNPHFMFNSLNNIASQIPERPETALEMTHDLSDFLRYSLDREGTLIATMAQEVEVMTAYLKIEKLRFEERLDYKVDVEADTLRMKVPSFLLQPLVENAVKHGLNGTEPPWTLTVGASRDGDRLCLRICNSGELDEAWESKPGLGIGVDNLRRRLALHYPGRHQFELRQEGGLVCALLTLTGEPCEV